MTKSNFILVNGSKLPSPSNPDKTGYQFSYIDFSKVEVLYLDNSWQNDTSKSDSLKKIIESNPHTLVIDTIGNVGGLKHGDEGMTTDLMTDAEAVQYNNVPCAMQTPAGSIIPMIIVPGESYSRAKNGLVVSGSSNYSQAAYVIQSGSSYMYLYNWSASITVNNGNDFDGGNDITVFGLRAREGYVSNEISARSIIDRPCYATREYKLTLNSNNSEFCPGSCVFGYYIEEGYNPVGVGSTQTEQNNSPGMAVTFESSPYTDDSTTSVSTSVAMGIPPEGEIKFSVGNGSKSESGSFKRITSDIVPPYCRKSENGNYNLENIYLIPTYAGMIFTNTVVSMKQSKDNCVYVRYADVLDPVMEAVIKNDGGAKTDDVVASIKESGQELMQWFPSVMQERKKDLQGEMPDTRVKVPYKNTIRFGNTVKVRFTKCLGRWAYCPIFFQRHVRITYYFKGEYVSDNETEGKYRFYPVVCSNVGKSTKWTGISSSGAASISGITTVWKDTSKQEAVYAVNLNFNASSYQRYPMEIFGMCVVYKYKEFQFSITNGNGEFKFNTDFQQAFSYIYRTRSDHKFFDLITNCSISATMDGVSGSLNFDGYALQGSISTWMQDQSLGEVDINLQWLNETRMINGKPYSEALFKGYAGEIQTQGNEGNYGLTVNLYGTDRKMSDMKLICAPFWDGDKLRTICKYFEAYLNLKLYMCDYSVKSYSDFKGTDKSWEASDETVTGIKQKSKYFRVPTSVDWKSPSIDFQTGTECMTALKELATKCGCLFIVQPDGKGVFYEMNMTKGYPFYVTNQSNSSVVTFSKAEIISFTMSPALDNNFNSIATFGFLKVKSRNGRDYERNDLQPGSFYTKIDRKHAVFPWSKPTVGVESGFYTASQLARVHANRVIASQMEVYKGTLTVVGNNKVNHIYQRINVGTIKLFVISIEHSIDMTTKMWTTTYNVNWANNLDD